MHGVLGRWPWDWFGTHTFREETHPEAADKLFRVFVSKVNRALFGIRWYKHGRSIRWVRELQRRGVIHFHTLMGGAGLSELRRLSYMDLWNELAGYARITPPKNGSAVRRYCAKYIVKDGEIDIGGALERPPPTFFSAEGPVFGRDVWAPTWRSWCARCSAARSCPRGALTRARCDAPHGFGMGGGCCGHP